MPLKAHLLHDVCFHCRPKPPMPTACSYLRVLLLMVLAWLGTDGNAAGPQPFGIHVVDEQTGRGIPLIELRTVNDIRSVTDNAGWIAFHEPGLMGREVWFYVSGPGYTKEKDGFGYTGVRLTPKAGETTVVKLKRTNLAERVGRLTGQGLYRDSELLGLPCPLPNLNPGGVMGSDSVNATPYRGSIFWLWGDTNVPHYPLGNYRTTCATTPLNASPEQGLAFDYFMDREKPQQLRHMMPMKEQGAVWLFGLLTVKDDAGKEVMLAHWGRHEGLKPPTEHGIARFNDERGTFERATELPKDEAWRFPQGHAVRATDDSGDIFYFSKPFLHTRVKATLKDVLDPKSYESLRYDEAAKVWRWQREQPPTTQADEQVMVLAGKMREEDARFFLRDAGTRRPVRLHNASIQWNAWRKRWVLIGVQQGDKEAPSFLGEVWYAESAAPDGPWSSAVKVVSHPRYSFYNPIHHGFLDADGGKVIYFEGTYTLEFSGNPLAPARYDYNQMMYRLDLGDARLDAVRSKDRTSRGLPKRER